jgi:photosystem II stability/assembly factor-like uncharacterized protein
VPSPSFGQYAWGQGPLALFPDARHWLVISRTTIWRTENAGATWSHAAMRVPAGLQLTATTLTAPTHGRAEAAPPDQIGWIPGGSTLLRTGDGGEHWTPVAIL